MEIPIKADVMIIGAGPTGLALACQLVRFGIDFAIIEKNDGVTPYSKAIGVHARTLEIYEQLGIAQEAVKEGAIARKVRMLVGGIVRGEMDWSHIGEGMSPYPFVLMLEQSKNERLLYEYLQLRRKEVLWKTELKNFAQNDSGVAAQVKSADGTIQTIEAKYLIGCDGAKSPTRHLLELEFSGSTFERMFFVADAQVDWHLSHVALHICLSKDSFVVFFPLKGIRCYRIVGVFPEEFSKDEGDVLYEEIEQRIKAEAQLDLDIHDVEWFSTYKVHTRHVSHFSKGRCFLAGDSAHIHSPAGAQGMNTGIQDSYNFAWKLALVLQGKADVKILKTYDQERLENARHLLQTTDRLFQYVAGSSWFTAFMRMNVFPLIAKYIFNFDAVKKFIFPQVSQIAIHYRNSPLSRHDGDKSFNVKAGDRMPYFLIDSKSIYDRLQQPKFHWLVFSDAPGDFQALQTELETHYGKWLDCNAVPLSPQITKAFGTDQSFTVLLRPDNYIGYISTETSVAELKAYLNDFVGWT